MEELKKINNGNNTLIFNGKTISFNPALFYYAEMEYRFSKIVVQTQAEIDKKFSSELGNMNDFIEHIDSFLKNIYNPLLDFSIKQLSLLGCYNFDKETFVEKYVNPKFEELLEIKQKLEREEDRIEANQDARNEMRVERRHAAENREVFRKDRQNATYTHGAMNLLGRAMDGIRNSTERSNIYNSVKDKIKNELDWICCDMVGSVAHAIYKNTGFDIRDPRTYEDYQKAENIFKNIKDGNVSADHLEQAALEVFSSNPAEDGFLIWCVKQYADPNGDFETAAQIFHIDLAEIKYKMLQATVKLDTEEQALASKEQFLQKEQQLSFKAPELLKKIDSALIKFDLEARTVHEVEFKTREEADEARIQAKKLEEIMSSGSSTTEDGTKALMAKIEEAGLTVCFAEDVKKELKQKLVKFDLEARIVCGKEFNTRAEADNARAQQAKMNKILQNGDLSTEEGTKAILNELENSELDAFFVIDKKKELKEALVCFDKKFRTVDGIEYKTREEAELARKEFEILNQTIERHKLNNPEQCQQLLNAIAALNLKTIVAQKTINRIESLCSSQNQKIEKIQEKYHLSQEQAYNVFHKYTALSHFTISGLTIFDPIESNVTVFSVNFKVSIDEIILGHLDLYQNQKQGLLITDKGIYSSHIPFMKSKIVTRVKGLFIGWILGGVAYGLFKNFLPEEFCSILSFAIMLSPLIFQRRIFKKIDAANEPSFTLWKDVVLQISSDKKVLCLSEEHRIALPPNSAMISQFHDFHEALKEQQQLSSK